MLHTVSYEHQLYSVGGNGDRNAIFVWSVTYSVHKWPQSKSAVHATSCDDDVSSQIQAAADGRGPDKERGFCLQEHVSEEE